MIPTISSLLLSCLAACLYEQNKQSSDLLEHDIMLRSYMNSPHTTSPENHRTPLIKLQKPLLKPAVQLSTRRSDDLLISEGEVRRRVPLQEKGPGNHRKRRFLMVSEPFQHEIGTQNDGRGSKLDHVHADVEIEVPRRCGAIPPTPKTLSKPWLQAVLIHAFLLCLLSLTLKSSF